MNASEKLPRNGHIQTIYDYLLGLIKKIDASIGSVRSRMNALTTLANSGGVPAGTIEAEVVDARVDSTGQVYANLGEAVRSMQSGYRQIDFGWEYGTVDANGNEATATTVMRSAFLPADLLRGVTLNIASEDPLSSGERVNDWFYDENKNFIRRGGAYTATAKISIPSEAVYVRFVAAAATPDKVSAVVLARQYDVVLNNAIDDVRQGMEDAERDLAGIQRDIDAICDGYKNLDFGWEYGTVNANGNEAPATTVMRSAFLPAGLLGGVTLNINADEPLSSTDRVACWTYAADKTAQGIYKRITASVTLNDIPSDAAYLRFISPVQTVDKLSIRVMTRELDSAMSAAVVALRAELESVRSALSDHSAVSLNRDKEHLLYSAWQSCAPRLQGSSLDDGDGTALGFLHFSDVHGTLISWKRLGAYLDHFSDLFSFALHTGDYVPSNQGNYNPTAGNMYQRVATEKPILNCVGNHDTLLSDGVTKNPDSSAARNILFADIENWGVNQPSDEVMYYYKDFGNVRLIVLDQYYTDATETAWLTGLLDDARTNGKSVITASHTQTAPITRNISTFNDVDRPSSALLEANGFESVIKAFKDAGGTHICHLGGHWHWDVVGFTDNGILNILVECATIYGGGYRNDIRRTGVNKPEGASRAYDCFNAVFVDTFTHTIRIIRIGSNTDNYLHPKNTLCIKYDNNTLVSNA